MKYSRDEVIKKLNNAFCYVYGTDMALDSINLDNNLIDDYHFSSVALLYFAIIIESEFQISLEDINLGELNTVNDFVDYIMKKLDS